MIDYGISGCPSPLYFTRFFTQIFSLLIASPLFLVVALLWRVAPDASVLVLVAEHGAAAPSSRGCTYNTGRRRCNEWRRTGGKDITEELFLYENSSLSLSLSLSDSEEDFKLTAFQWEEETTHFILKSRIASLFRSARTDRSPVI